MESDAEIYRASSARSSIRANSSNLWRNDEFFSQSSYREDDEGALIQWAAIEKLPTYRRITRAILKDEEGPPREIDVKDLGFFEKRNLVERLLKIAEEDNEKLLLKLKKRIDRVGLELPTIEVRFEHLNVHAEAHVGSRALPTLINFTVNFVEGFLNDLRILPSRKKPMQILRDVNGIIKPGRLTLLLGPPSSGKTTLLLALAGKLDTDLKVSGRVTYNGHGMDEFVPQRTSAYISQHDLHMGELTVRETLAFSARCQGVGTLYEMLAELSRREKEANIKPDPDIDIFMKAASLEGQEASVVTDYILKILGLEICADAMVGDEMRRGISGGQKKRVTTGEMLVGPARVLLMDEISTGLDSSTTFQIVNSIRQSIHILQGTSVISLLQPAPETYDLFDDIILLSDGQIVYQGPRECVLEFFEHMGFKCPERKGVADFLQEVTSRKDQKQYWAKKDEPYSYVQVKEFAEAFKSFHVGQKLGDKLAVPFDKAKGHPAALTTKKYGVSKKELLKACTSREYLLMKRNSFIYIFKLAQLTLMAFITMTLFLRTEMPKKTLEDGGIFMGALFFTLIMIMFNGYSEIALSIMKLPVFYKQRDFLFFPAWAYTLPTWFLKIPVTIVEVAAWVFVTYYVIGFEPDAGRLFRQYLLLLFVNQMSSALFRFVGGIGRNIIVANTFGSFALLTVLVLGGFVLSRENIKKWWIWGYWMSPMMYGQNALAVNEFLGKSWSQIPLNSNETLGVQVLKSRGIFPEAHWYWLGLGATLGFFVAFQFLYTLALTYLNPFGKPQAILTEETSTERIAVKTGELVELSSSRDITSNEKGSEVRRSASSTSMATGVGSITDAGQNRKRGMVLPFQPLSIAFDEIRYSVDMPQEMKDQGIPEDRLELLKGVSGAFRPGVLTALMGVSGAGKTTLMDVLAGRKTGGYIEGRITISGYPKKQETFARISGYCEQTDIHSPHVTVYESLQYSAWLRLPTEVDSAAKKLVLLKRGGKEIYVGPLGRLSVHLITYFEGINGVSKIKDGYNPATWMLEVTSSASETALGVDFASLYKNSELYRRNKDLIKELSVPTPGSKDIDFSTKYSQPFFTQCMACLWKQHWSYWRNPPYCAVRFLFTTFIALMFGTIFWDLGSKRDSRQDLFNAMGSMFVAVLFIGIQNATSVQPVVGIERTVFYRERAAGMYSALPYAFGQVVIEIPYIFVQTITYGVIVYAMIGFEWTAAKFLWYIFFMYFTLLYYTFYGMMAVAVTPNHHIATIVSTAFYLIWMLFSGFIIPSPRMPGWWKWYTNICPVSWTMYGLVASQFGDLDNEIEPGETMKAFIDSYYGFEHDFLGFVALIIVGFVVLFGFIFAFSIRAFNFQKR
ncbi:hypothetical protein RHMOL_Rhmol04G0105600 [Rhododendron molle]|uniref:Uncharacterized protein n=1 Tax=Rhododendron molle TaxID=49168 RepID=A0ACC0NZ16_RHOML|nr:hypothetical protein RHMOL_Rhmol04G0105600 [Rhododendron molle]